MTNLVFMLDMVGYLGRVPILVQLRYTSMHVKDGYAKAFYNPTTIYSSLGNKKSFHTNISTSIYNERILMYNTKKGANMD